VTAPSLSGEPRTGESGTTDRGNREPDRTRHGASTLDLSGRCVGSSYILVRPIGQGATGTVWRGVDRASGEPVAVKLLHESLLRQPKLVTRFVQERTILLMLRHRNVVRVRDLFSVGESLGLVMDLVPGGSLREHLRTHRTVPAGEAARLCGQVAAALAEAHDLGVIHRDLKPDNILLQSEDGRLETRLTDFGIARVLNTPSLTTPHAVVGTPHYMAPEAFHGAPTSPAADVYALGVLLYELVVGCPPFLSDSVGDLMRRHLEEAPQRPTGIPDELWEVIASCLEKKPRLRPSAAELVAELGAVSRDSAGVPALPHPRAGADDLPRPSAVDGPDLRQAVRHPSLPGSPHPVPQPRNQVPAWRWARPWAVVVLVGGAMIGTGLATSAWHLSRQGSPAGAAPVSVPSTLPDVASTQVTVRPSARTAAVPVRATPSKPPPARAAATRSTATGGGAADGGGASNGGDRVRETRPYGPWQCRESFRWGYVNSVLATPCHALGTGVQLRGEMGAAAGARATLTVSLRDAATGRVVGAAHRCSGEKLTGDDMSAVCGPVIVKPPRGHRYEVVLAWRSTRGGETTEGVATGEEFSW
jgi:serine/threonine protein kinase